jgi:hypothetical protein
MAGTAELASGLRGLGVSAFDRSFAFLELDLQVCAVFGAG